MACWITARTENMPVKKIELRVSIISKTSNTCHTYQLKFHVQQLSSQNRHFAVRIKKLME